MAKDRVFVIQAIQDGPRGQYWTNYDTDIPSLADGNERMAWLAADQPERSFQLVEVLSYSDEGEARS